MDRLGRRERQSGGEGWIGSEHVSDARRKIAKRSDESCALYERVRRFLVPALCWRLSANPWSNPTIMSIRTTRSGETSLYSAVKVFLERRGFTVKGEVCGCDIVAIREGEPPLVVVTEMKMAFSLELVLQGVERARLADEVWLAVRATRRGRDQDHRVRRLCRLLGFGLLLVDPARGWVEIAAGPLPYRPRPNLPKRARVIREFKARRGDPNAGGSVTATAHDCIPAAGARLRCGYGGGTQEAPRVEADYTGSRRHPAAQRVWLVRAHRAWRLSADRRGARGSASLAWAKRPEHSRTGPNGGALAISATSSLNCA